MNKEIDFNKYLKISKILPKNQEEFNESLYKLLELVNKISQINTENFEPFRYEWIKTQFREDFVEKDQCDQAKKLVSISRDGYFSVPLVVKG
jgi:aspartyl/glutamyl-tRNA(Asn/Gln) amidotransferase C subunit